MGRSSSVKKNFIEFVTSYEEIYDEIESNRSLVDEYFEDDYLISILSRLSYKDRKVLFFKYKAGFTLQEMADYVNVSCSRMSQIHTKAIRSARIVIEADLAAEYLFSNMSQKDRAVKQKMEEIIRQS